MKAEARRQYDLLRGRAESLYRAIQAGQTASPEIRLSCHALAWRHLHDDQARNRARDAFLDLPEMSPHDHATLPALLRSAALALGAGVDEANGRMGIVWEAMERLYRREGVIQFPASTYTLSACDALLTAFATCGDLRFLRRAEALAKTVALRQRLTASDRIPWALCLLRLAQHPVALATPGDWLLPRATQLFTAAAHGIPPASGFPVWAEALAAATILARHPGSAAHFEWQLKLWPPCWQACLGMEQGSAAAAVAALAAIDHLAPVHAM